MGNLKDMIEELKNDLNVIKSETSANEDINAELINDCWNEVFSKLDKIEKIA